MRYPTRNGLALSPLELGYEIVEPKRGKTNNHHLYYDRAWYQDKRYRQIFRGLAPHVQTLWIPEHEELHDKYKGPIMPSDSLQISVIDEYLSINGVINVVREHKTCETYQVQAEQWEQVRKQYRSGYARAS